MQICAETSLPHLLNLMNLGVCTQPWLLIELGTAMYVALMAKMTISS